MKKIALLFLLTTVLTTLNAEECSEYYPAHQTEDCQTYTFVPQNQSQCGDCNYVPKQEYSCGINEYVSSCDSCNDDCNDAGSYYEIGADWIYWKPFQDNLGYASLVTLSTPGIGDETTNVTVVDPDFEHDSGFRVYANYCCGCTDWRFSAIFTRIVSHTRDSLSVDPANIANNFITLNPLVFPTIEGEGGIPFSNVDSKWSLSFNYLDIDFGRCYNCIPCFDITPHFGLRVMWIRQKFNVDAFVPESGSQIETTVFTNARDKFNGVGLEGGLIANWELCWGFYLTGYINTSLVYAKIKTNHDFTTITEEGTLINSLNVSDRHLCPMIDGFIGLGYEQCFGCVGVDLHIGWEQHVIINSSHLNVFDYSSLSLQGLTLGGGISF